MANGKPSCGFALRTALGLFATCSALWLAAAATQGSASAWPRFEDDAYYYLAIARNVVSGLGASADGISPTNGYQPLWMWLLVPLAWLTSADTVRFLAATQLLVVLVFCVSGGLLAAQLRERLGLWPALLGVGLFLFPTYRNVLVSGMESGLAVWIAVAAIAELARGPALADPEPAEGDARSGLWFALLFLARLDSVFVTAGAALWIGVSSLSHGGAPFAARVTRALRKGVSVFWPAVLLAAPYLAWNVIGFGHLVPISGALKTSHSQLAFEPRMVDIAYRALLALVGVAAVVERRATGDRGLARVLGALGLGIALQALHAMVFMSWAVFAWHFAVFIPLGAVAIATLARAAAERVPRWAARAAVAAAAVGLAAAQPVSISRLHLTFTGASRDAGEWVAKSLPPDAVLAMKDSGAFSWFAERRVVNLDGVANSFEFEETLCRGELAEFLASHGVGYVAQHAVPPEVRDGSYERWTQTYPCHFAGGRDSELTFERTREVFRGRPYQSYGSGEHQLVIWKIAK